jgi:hypothetical protein
MSMPEVILYAVVLPVSLFAIETIALTIWLYRTSEPNNKLIKKGNTNGR